VILYERLGEVNPYVVVEASEPGSNTGQTLYEMAYRLMNLVQANFTCAGIPLPERAVIYPSPIPADCEQVAVLFTGWTPYPQSDGPQVCEGFRWMGDFSVIITRCTPAMVPKTATKSLTPAPEKMHEAALMASQDAEILLAVLHDLGEFASPSVTVQSPVGGLQTTEMDVQIPVGGI